MRSEVCVWTTPFPPDGVNVDVSGSPLVNFGTECPGLDTIVYIPDGVFLNALISDGVDTNGDYLISYSEAARVSELSFTGGYHCNGGDGECIVTGELRDLQGIEAFTNLEKLVCYNQVLTELDLSACQKLRYLDCHNNRIQIEFLNCSENLLTEIDVENCVNLETFYCRENGILNLNLIQNTKLHDLMTGSNPLESLDVTHCS